MKRNALSIAAGVLIVLLLIAIKASYADVLQFHSATEPNVHQPPQTTPVCYDVALTSASPILPGACQAPPPPAPTSTCPTIGAFSRWTGTQAVNFTSGPTPRQVDVTSFASAFQFAGKLWPGISGVVPMIPLPVNRYLALQFTVPSNASATLLGTFLVGDTGYSAPLSMTISTACGDFRDPAAGSTVVAGCRKNAIAAHGGFSWHISGQGCVLQPGRTYYLNIINADVSGALPVSTANGLCINKVCSDPILNQFSP